MRPSITLSVCALAVILYGCTETNMHCKVNDVAVYDGPGDVSYIFDHILLVHSGRWIHSDKYFSMTLEPGDKVSCTRTVDP